MIRFAPQAAQIATPLKAIKEGPAIEPAKVTDESKATTDSGSLLAELPEVSAPAPSKASSSHLSTKARAPKKSKAGSDATAAMQLDLNA
ncbi:hypothetical protein PY650_03890 [Rhizobium calliandrae]|uniref:Poly(Hydroxyalkanoate) granule-associated protein n=1 Tax=Rhizobium calliandrae TaxID=1312182 RepID=A0ABT7K9X2_9HYPH|nr:hypothetical protein [Rhizobium calliandrae]MDL2404810.1 hypothetical protein [Rhizobium calliandrae]